MRRAPLQTEQPCELLLWDMLSDGDVVAIGALVAMLTLLGVLLLERSWWVVGRTGGGPGDRSESLRRDARSWALRRAAAPCRSSSPGRPAAGPATLEAIDPTRGVG